jgi:DNA-binding CsgD family transcriptional regulator/tetratricopeptide (TPR) repeat protein
MTRLLERDGELSALRAAGTAAADGRGSIVLVAGEAGIGKSTLVQAWSADPGGDARVLVGWCDDFLTSRLLGPFHDIARRAGGALAAAVSAGDIGAVLEATLAELGYPLQPTVLLLEDVHWADEATLDVVRYVGRRIHTLPAVLGLTYRDDDVGPDHPLRGVLGALAPGAVHRIQLRRLSRAAVAELTRGSGLDPDEVVAVTGGNPFFVTELAHDGSGVPVNVTDAVLARVRTLSEPSRRAVEALSVVPGTVAGALVDVLVRDPGGLGEAERRGVLVADGPTVRFRHELARQAVLGSTPVAVRAGYHRQVLGHLLDGDADPSMILHHAVEAGRIDVVARYGPAAASAAYRAGAHREAAGHHQHVLRHPELLDPQALAGLLEEHAWSLYNLHRFEAAAAAAERAVATRAGLDDPGALVRALLISSRMLYMLNRPQQAFEVLSRAERTLESFADAEVQAEFRAHRLSLLHLTDHHHSVAAEHGELVTLADRLGRADLRVYGEVYGAGSKVMLGDDRALGLIEEAIRFGRERGQLEPVARAYTNLIEFLMLLRRWDDARERIEEAVAFYDDHDFWAHRYNTVGQRARLLILQGDWRTGADVLRELAGAVAAPGVLEAIPLEARALLAVRSGAADAEALLGRAWEVSLRTQSAQYVAPVACAGIEWAWMAGRPEAAEPFIQAALSQAQDIIWLGWVRWRLPLVGGAPDPEGVLTEPERTSLSGDWRSAADQWAALRLPFEQALELVRSGEAAATLEALRIFEALGSQPAARMARRRLQDLGIRSIPRGPLATTRKNPMGLTDRQMDVLTLLAEGLTNAQIADRLVVSVRTVDHHVSAILQKLGVSTRQEAVERAALLRAV